MLGIIREQIRLWLPKEIDTETNKAFFSMLHIIVNKENNEFVAYSADGFINISNGQPNMNNPATGTPRPTWLISRRFTFRRAVHWHIYYHADGSKSSFDIHVTAYVLYLLFCLQDGLSFVGLRKEYGFR